MKFSIFIHRLSWQNMVFPLPCFIKLQWKLFLLNLLFQWKYFKKKFSHWKFSTFSIVMTIIFSLNLREISRESIYMNFYKRAAQCNHRKVFNSQNKQTPAAQLIWMILEVFLFAFSLSLFVTHIKVKQNVFLTNLPRDLKAIKSASFMQNKSEIWRQCRNRQQQKLVIVKGFAWTRDLPSCDSGTMKD